VASACDARGGDAGDAYACMDAACHCLLLPALVVMLLPCWRRDAAAAPIFFQPTPPVPALGPLEGEVHLSPVSDGIHADAVSRERLQLRA
jgi:hypothetical protein